MIKVYISNIAMGWPVERQKDLLATQVAGWPTVPTLRRSVAASQTQGACGRQLIAAD